MTDPLRYIRKAIIDALPGIPIYDMVSNENEDDIHGVVNLASYSVDEASCKDITAEVDLLFFALYQRKGGSLAMDTLMDTVLTLLANGEQNLAIDNFHVNKCTITSSQSDGVFLFNRMMYRRTWRVSLLLTDIS